MQGGETPPLQDVCRVGVSPPSCIPNVNYPIRGKRMQGGETPPLQDVCRGGVSPPSCIPNVNYPIRGKSGFTLPPSNAATTRKSADAACGFAASKYRTRSHGVAKLK